VLQKSCSRVAVSLRMRADGIIDPLSARTSRRWRRASPASVVASSMKVRRLNSPPGIASLVAPVPRGTSPEIAAGYFTRARDGRIARSPRTESRGAARLSNDRRLKRVPFDLCTDVAGFAAPYRKR
jgi:hypothetical protein